MVNIYLEIGLPAVLVVAGVILLLHTCSSILGWTLAILGALLIISVISFEIYYKNKILNEKINNFQEL